MTDEYEQKLYEEQNTPTLVEGNNFLGVEEFVSQEGLEGKKDIINKVLSDNKIKEGFANFLESANMRTKLKIKKDLQNCQTEEEVKSIIVENIPGYKIGQSDAGTDNINNQNEDNLINTVINKKENKAQAEELEEKSVEVIEGENRMKAMNEAVQYVQYLKDTHKLDVGQGIDLYENTKKYLEDQGIISKLRQDNNSEEFINKYIAVRAAFEEVKHNTSEYSQDEILTFDKIVKNLNNACHIPDTNLESFENVSQIRTELFNEDIGNNSLISMKKSNIESRDYSEVFKDMGFEEVSAKYGRFLQGDLKEFWNQYQSSTEIRDKISGMRSNPNPTDEDLQLYNRYNKMFLALMGNEYNPGIKDIMENKTKDLIEELCIISQVKGMYMCMGEDLGNDFNLNKANEIESENGVLTLRGHIDGVDFAIRQDTNNPESRLQTSLKLNKSSDGNSFILGGKNNFVDSNFILPSQNEVFATITEVVKSGVSLEDFDNQNEYFENLQSSIMGNMGKKYADTKYIHHYMKDRVLGEKVVNGVTGLIQKIKSNEDFSKPINQANNGKMFNFMKIISFNIENSTVYEKDKLNQCISKIRKIVDYYRQNSGNDEGVKYPPIIENFLKNNIWLSGGDEEKILGGVFDLFSFYNEHSQDTRSNKEGTDGVPSKIIINDLYRDLFEPNNDNKESQQSLVSQQRNDENNSLVTSIDNDNFNWPNDGYLSQTVDESGISVA